MDPVAFSLVVASAVLHASWNLVVKASEDRLVAAAAQVTFGAVAFFPVLVVSGVPTEAWVSIAASAIVHLVYGLTLVGAYERADLSLVYPVARGTAPVLVTVGAALLLSDTPGGAGTVAIVLIVAGVLVTGLDGRSRRGLAWALATAVLIATYTVIDGHAVRSLDGSFSYTISVFVGSAIAFALVLAWRRRPREIAAAVRSEWVRHLGAGAASVGAYVLVLIAARRAPLGLVAAVRETSVVMGAIGGWVLLREPFRTRRLGGILVIAAGLTILALTR